MRARDLLDRDRLRVVDRPEPELAEQDRGAHERREHDCKAKRTHGAMLAAVPDGQTSGTGPCPFEETTVFFPRRFAS